MKTQSFELPSKGYFYGDNDPLSSGELELRYMTASDEDILTDKQYAQKGETLDRLLESVIADSEVNLDTMLVGDKSAAIVATRIMAYGPDYTFKFSVPGRNETETKQIDLTQIKDKDVDFSEFDKNQKTFEHTLPVSEDVVTFKLLRHSDQRDIRFEKKRLKKAGGPTPTVTLRLKHQIVSVNGGKGDLSSYIDNMLARDSMSLRSRIDEVSPDINMEFEYENGQGGVDMVPISIEPEFFFPSGMTT